MLATVIGALLAGHLVFVAVKELAGSDVLWPLSLSAEDGIGTPVSAVLLGAVAVACLFAAAVAAGRQPRGFRVLAAALVLLAFDEVTAQHERVGHALRDRFDLDGYLYFAWMVPAAAIVAAFVAWQWRFFRSLDGPLRTPLLLAAGLYVGGALGIELIQSKIFSEEGEATLNYELLVAVEETLEMVGPAVALVALVNHLARRAPSWRLRFAERAVAVEPVGTFPERTVAAAQGEGAAQHPGSTAPVPLPSAALGRTDRT